MVRKQREQAGLRDKIAQERMASFERQKEEERLKMIEMARIKAGFIQKAIEQSQAIHEERKQQILAAQAVAEERKRKQEVLKAI